MKKADTSQGAFMCFLMNLMADVWWILIFAVLLVLHFVLGVPAIFAWLALLIWPIHGAINTALMYWGNKAGNLPPDPPKENKNPYSATHEEVFPGVEKKSEAPQTLTISPALEQVCHLLYLTEEETKTLRNAESPDQLLDMLVSQGHLCYLYEGNPYWEIAYALDTAGKKAGFAPIEPQFMEDVPEAKGMTAAGYLASKISDRRLFLVVKAGDEDYNGGFYAGVITEEQADLLTEALQASLAGKFGVILLKKDQNE